MLIVAILEILVCALVCVYLLKRKQGKPFSIGEAAKFIVLGMLSWLLLMFLPLEPRVFFNMSNPLAAGVLTALLLAALPEELSKYVFFRLGLIKDKQVQTWHDAILACVLVAAGFTFAEGIEYAFFGGANIVRAFVPAHLLFQIAMGYFFGKACVTKNAGNHVLSLAVPIVLHTLFDMFPITLAASIGGDTSALSGLTSESLQSMPHYNLMLVGVGGTIVISIVTVAALIVMVRKVGKWGKEGQKQDLLK